MAIRGGSEFCWTNYHFKEHETQVKHKGKREETANRNRCLITNSMAVIGELLPPSASDGTESNLQGTRL